MVGYFPCLSCRTLPGGDHTADCNLGPGAPARRTRLAWAWRLWLEMPRHLFFDRWLAAE